MSTHAFFSPSKSAMWMNCPGAMAFPENQGDGDSSTFADNGTASHHWSAECLEEGLDADGLLGATQTINGVVYTMDEERAGYCQMYIDDVRRRALGGRLFVEQKIDLSDYLGEGQGGTGDAAIYHAARKLLVSEDLKYGTGEKVYASYVILPATPECSEVRAPNTQLALYALGLLKDAALLGEVERVLLVVHQPRLGHVDEFEMSVADLRAFGEIARQAVAECGHAMVMSLNEPDFLLYLKPAEKTCRWCRAKTQCPKLAARVAEEVRADFDTIIAEPPLAPRDTALLGKALIAVPLIELWCKAVKSEAHRLVSEGEKIIGPDGLPYKFVEGDEGKRLWADEAAAEGLLLGQLSPDKVYTKKLITAPAAGKLLNKKATKALWTEIFEPLITRAKGKPQMALGSDSRPPYTGAADAKDFDEIDITE